MYLQSNLVTGGQSDVQLEPTPHLPISRREEQSGRLKSQTRLNDHSAGDFRATYVLFNGVSAVFSSNASSPRPSADRGSPFYGEIFRDRLAQDSEESSTLRCLPARVSSSDKQKTALLTFDYRNSQLKVLQPLLSCVN